jgi:hypothetical protein
LDVKDILRERVPHLLFDFLAREFRDGFFVLVAHCLVGAGLARKADDVVHGRHIVVAREVVKRGDEFTAREVTRCAKDDDGRRLGRARHAHSLAERVQYRASFEHGFFLFAVMGGCVNRF